jgi:hypothetical protein
MAAAISSRRANNSASKARSSELSAADVVTFHLGLQLGQNYRIPEGKNSVWILRSPFQHANESLNASNSHSGSVEDNLNAVGKSCFPCSRAIIFDNKHSNEADTRLEFWAMKFNNKVTSDEDEDGAWQYRLIILTAERLYLITVKDSSKEKLKQPSSPGTSSATKITSQDLEIIDSIPLEEIIDIDLNGTDNLWKEVEGERKSRTCALFNVAKKSWRSSMKHFTFGDDDPEFEKDQAVEERQKIESTLRTIEPVENCGRVLRIITKPNGFNRGAPYYLAPNLESVAHVRGSAETGPAKYEEGNAEQLCDTLRRLAERRRTDFERSTRFVRLQASLQRVWNSLPFNLLVLALILSLIMPFRVTT